MVETGVVFGGEGVEGSRGRGGDVDEKVSVLDVCCSFRTCSKSCSARCSRARTDFGRGLVVTARSVVGGDEGRRCTLGKVDERRKREANAREVKEVKGVGVTSAGLGRNMVNCAGSRNDEQV